MSTKKPKAKLASHDAAPETPNPSGNFWTVRIEPGTFTDLAQYITAGTLIMKNLGPESVMIDTGYAADDVRLRPGQAQIMATRNHIRIGTTGALPALVEFDFMPALK